MLYLSSMRKTRLLKIVALRRGQRPINDQLYSSMLVIAATLSSPSPSITNNIS